MRPGEAPERGVEPLDSSISLSLTHAQHDPLALTLTACALPRPLRHPGALRASSICTLPRSGPWRDLDLGEIWTLAREPSDRSVREALSARQV